MPTDKEVGIRRIPAYTLHYTTGYNPAKRVHYFKDFYFYFIYFFVLLFFLHCDIISMTIKQI